MRDVASSLLAKSRACALLVPVVLVVFAIAGAALSDAAWIGMSVASLDAGKAAEMGVPANAGNVVVVKVKGPALASGVIVGDVVLAVNDQDVQSPGDFLAAARAAVKTAKAADRPLGDVVLTLSRFGSPTTVIVPGEWAQAYGR